MADREWLAQKAQRAKEEADKIRKKKEADRKYRAHMKWRGKEQRRCAAFAKTPEQRNAELMAQLAIFKKQEVDAKKMLQRPAHRLPASHLCISSLTALFPPRRAAFCDNLASKVGFWTRNILYCDLPQP